jgi:hypothetical protein
MSSTELPDLEHRRLRLLRTADVGAAAPMHADDYQLAPGVCWCDAHTGVGRRDTP